MGLTPMMQQYFEIKEKCKDCILFFRLGDFYEMFFNDAEIASKELELVLTGRDCGLDERAPMCGIPYHAANIYISRLINRGYKIAICEQLEDPSVAQGIVKRDIIKVITPGTYTDSSFLEENKNNYIMSVYIEDNRTGICFADISTGEFNCTECIYEIAQILNEISKFMPKEILVQEGACEEFLNSISERFEILITEKPNEYYTEHALSNITKQFKKLKEDHFSSSAVNSINGLLNYIIETQKTDISHIDEIEFYNVVDFMSIDMNSRRNLELTETIRDKSKKGSLLWVIDKTSTCMGSRLLRKWIEQPLIDKDRIQQRLDAVEELLGNVALLDDLKLELNKIYDIERIVGKISTQNVNAKELNFLKNSTERLPGLKRILGMCQSTLLSNLFSDFDVLDDINNLLEESITENPSLSVKEGNIIKDNYNAEVDELRTAKLHGKEWIASLESNEKEATGIKSLKIGYNKVFGYYIEISKSNYNLIPEGRYIRKQTLANAERYITPELKDMEDKILGAEEKLVNLEYKIFCDIRDNIGGKIDRMKATAKILSVLDCICSLASVALENGYCKPEINTKDLLIINDGRHPVVEKMISTGSFISNDINMDTSDSQLLLITGPNMAGKSTYMRQIALIVIMAQIGSFVPAKAARISICDKLFTRIGASDDLAGGKSTFMVEMWEVSNILRNATRRSLILLDEVGRGTSTYDGLSIAWAVIEYLTLEKDIKCKTLFATHYHELTKLEHVIDGVKNYSVSVKEIGSEIVFLRKIVPGGADQSYGIEVAKLAGLPEKVISRSKEILNELEKGYDKEKKGSSLKMREAAYTLDKSPKQMNIYDIQKNNFIDEMASLDIMNMTPMECMNKLYEYIKKAKTI